MASELDLLNKPLNLLLDLPLLLLRHNKFTLLILLISFHCKSFLFKYFSFKLFTFTSTYFNLGLDSVCSSNL
jgi:hypothetical protein